MESLDPRRLFDPELRLIHAVRSQGASIAAFQARGVAPAPAAAVAAGGYTQQTSKVTETLTGDGSRTVFTVRHSLGSYDVVDSVRELPSRAPADATTVPTDENTLTVTFAAAPAAGAQFRVVVMA